MPDADTARHGEEIPGALGITRSSCGGQPCRPGILDRRRLTKLFLDDGDASVIGVLAPAGYGKTTAVQLWREADHRDFAWVHLSESDDDPVHLLRHIAAAIHLVSPVTDGLVRVLTGVGRAIDTEVLPALGGTIAERDPFVLVLDDAHLLVSEAPWAVIQGLLAYLPEGAQVALIGRAMPGLHRVRQRLSGEYVEHDAAELAMDESETLTLFAQDGFDLDSGDLQRIMSQTEGWPAGLGLAVLALREHDPADGARYFSGHDRLVADYLVEEVLAGVDATTAEFLLRSSVLDQMSPSLLDAVLDREDTARMLDKIERRGNLFLVPLDSQREWFRYHHLFGTMLRKQLEIEFPGELHRLHARASEALESRGDVDGAVRHAVAAGDTGRAADLVLQHTFEAIDQGEAGRLGQWLELLGDAVVLNHPSAAIASAWHAITVTDVTRLGQAIQAAGTITWEGPLADGTPSLAVGVAAVRALAAIEGDEGVMRDTAVVRSGGGPRVNPWWGYATALAGTTASLVGDNARAREMLVAGLGEVTKSPSMEAGFLGVLVLVEAYTGNLDEAERLTHRAMELCEAHNLEGVVLVIPAYAGAALVAAERGRVDEAHAASLRTRRLLARLGDLSPRSALRGYLALAQAARALGEHAEARSFAAEADRARQRDPSCTFLNELLDRLNEVLARTGQDPTSTVAPITAAELRILEYLPTHLTQQEIAAAVFVSRNTVKSHTLALYRKLDVSSRSAAVDEARRLGILPDQP